MSAAVEMTESLFEIYERRRAELLAIARRQHEILVNLEIDTIQADGTKPAAMADDLIRRLESERLRVLVIGRFSAGKSTFINALLGEAILPASPAPTTGVLCEVRYADEAHRKATLHPKPGLGPDGGSEPFDVTITDLKQQLNQYVKIDHRNAEVTSRYRKLELFLPLALCEHGVDLIDTVGLDDPDARDLITMEHAGTADAILYVMKSHDTYSAKDKQVISYLQALGYGSIFFVITYFDHIRESAAMGEMPVDEFVNMQRRNLAPWTELKNDGIMFVDSKSAVIGRINGDAARVAGSGIEEIERSLQEFLTEERGRAKLLTSLRSLRTANLAVRKTVPARINLWQTSAADLEKKYKDAEVPLQSLETQRQLMGSKVDIAVKDIAREARDMASRHLLELPDRIRAWAEEYEIEASLRFPTTKKNVQPLVDEVARRIKEQIEEDLARWTERELVPMVTARVHTLEESLEEHAREFVEKIDELRIQVSIGVDPTKVGQQEVSMLGRILAGTYSVVTLDFLTGSMGVFLGAKAMLTTMAIQFAAGAALAVLGLVNPFMLVAATVGGIAGGVFINMAALKREIKRKVGEAQAAEMVSRRHELSVGIEEKVMERVGEIKSALDAGLRAEIASVRGEVEAVLAARQEGQADADDKIRKLKEIEQANFVVEEKIEALMFEAGIR